MVIDIVDDDMDAEKKWRWFHSAVRRRARGGSKIIVISRTEAHSSFGTVPVLRLCPPRREELWYFFRVLAFGASDPDDRPDLARIAMTVCEDISDVALFAAANVAAASLRVNLNARFWRRVRKMYAEATVLQLGDKGEFYYLCRPVTDAPTAPFLFCNRRKLTGMAGSEFPKVRKLELLTGDTLPPAGETRFDVLIWQSRIPPYVSYVATCDMEARQVVVAGEKRVRKRGRDTDQKLIVA
ncbi:hypothetical protein QOZ80_1BG0053830 [Eleusine coracana subsp. coracana]|nr:hypothetical protein QOZ80_1BG0053830 [Eleusine coracana subsp. coracana]